MTRLIDLTEADLRRIVREEIERSRGAADAITVDEAARIASMHPATVRGWIREGRLPCVRLGRAVRVRRADVLGLVTPAEDPALARVLDMARRGA